MSSYQPVADLPTPGADLPTTVANLRILDVRPRGPALDRCRPAAAPFRVDHAEPAPRSDHPPPLIKHSLRPRIDLVHDPEDFSHRGDEKYSGSWESRGDRGRGGARWARDGRGQSGRSPQERRSASTWSARATGGAAGTSWRS